MSICRYSFVPALALALAACGGKPPAPAADSPAPPAAPAPAAEAPADAAAAPPTEAPAEAAAAAAVEGAAEAAVAPAAEAAPAVAAADLARGKVLFLQCKACHSLVPESEPGKIGPTLYGVIGRAAGSVSGFAYSEVVAKSGITWTTAEIDKWLQRPSDYLPGNKMVFVGLQNAQDRTDVIAYIQQESAKPAAQ